MHSAVEGIGWPALPPSNAAAVLAQVYQLEQSQWWPAALLRERQLAQLELLLRHAHRHSAFYRERLDAAGTMRGGPLDEDRFRAIPRLQRTELLAQESAITCREVPASHGSLGVAQTSGSTGQIVKVNRTSVTQLIWSALVMRDHAWHRRDVSQTLVSVRANVPVLDDETKAREVGWGPPLTWLYPTGPCYARPLGTDVAELGAWLRRRDPGYLLTYPTNLAALLTHFERDGQTLPRLREVRTVGETLAPELRARCGAVLGVPLVDSYSAQEVGAIALQCPDGAAYHVHAESLIVEVLDDEGRECLPGQLGRVVVTDLHNFATPLIRYELRDHAEVGSPCPCGRGLPTLTRILGRQRNMVVLPDGRRCWPLVGFSRYREIASIVQYQVVQHSLEEVEMRLVTERGALDARQEGRLSEVLCNGLGHPFRVRFSYFEGELPRTRSAKFEEFLSLVE
jgi:phenylacetate-CoA ligase